MNTHWEETHILSLHYIYQQLNLQNAQESLG